MITCRYCQATTKQINVGKSKTGLHVYRCKHCGQLYTAERERQPSSGPVPEFATVEYGIGEDRKIVVPRPGEVRQTGVRDITDHENARLPTHISAGADVLPKPSQPVSPDFETAPRRALRRPVSRKPRFFSNVVADSAVNRWGWLPEIALLEALGLLLLAWAFAGARAATASAETLWWIGLAVMILPVTLRLASVEASRRERIALVLLLGMGLYLIKIMHSPIAFTFPDEMSHLRNAAEIVESQRLFQENPIQPVTAYYPGLPTVTSTLSSLSGLSLFHAGILIIGTARLILFLSLYLLFEQVSGSARVAGLAAVLYMTNPNFLYWTAEYAYEPLALPVLVFVLLMVAKREMAEDRSNSKAWAIAAVFGLLTVVITHHMSSYILTALLVALTVLFILYSRGRHWGPWPIALVAVFATLIWLIFVAKLTIDYLSPVLVGAIQSVFRMIVEEETGRELFKSTTLSTETRAPIWEQFVALGSVVLITLGLPLGVLEIWQRHRNKVFAFLLGIIALLYLPVQALRFTKDGWETANRSSEFLFIGISFVVALGIVKFWLTNWGGSKSRFVLAGLSIVLFFGGLIAGWPPRARLARPYIIETQEHLVRPQVVTVSEWIVEHLGFDNRIAASKADAKVIGAYGQYPFTDNGPIKNLFLSEEFGDAEQNTLLKRNIQYVMVDRKVVSWDHMIGYYFYSSQSNRASDLRVLDPQTTEKFEGVEGISRVLDSGDIVIYGVEMYLEAYRESKETSGLGPTDVAWKKTPGNVTSGANGLTLTGLPPRACIWYMAQLSTMGVNLNVLSSIILGGPGQFTCLNWGVP